MCGDASLVVHCAGDYFKLELSQKLCKSAWSLLKSTFLRLWL